MDVVVGGAFQLTVLNRLIASRHPVSPSRPLSLPKSAIILDSCPANAGLEGTKRAFGELVRNPLIRGTMNFVITILYFSGWLLGQIGLMSKKRTVDELTEAINTPSPARGAEAGGVSVPWMSVQTPRLYVYSKADRLVPWSGVEMHGKEAQDWIGFQDVRMEKFEDSPHVAHARAYPDRYWGAVKELWKSVNEG